MKSTSSIFETKVEGEILMTRFANEEPCEVCGGSPTRLRYGDVEDDVFLCEEHYGEGEV